MGFVGRWSRRGMPSSAFDSWRAAMAADGLTHDAVLAWAPSLDREGSGLVVGSTGRLSIGVGQTGQTGHTWTNVGWHLIERGNWNGESRQLSWRCYPDVEVAARSGALTLPEPGRMPELFRERIAASVAVEERIDVGEGRMITVSARRDLSRPGAPVEWRTTLSRGVSWRTPGVSATAAAAVERLRAEYDRV